MLIRAVLAVLVLAALATPGCAPDYGHRGYAHRGAEDDAWNIVRSDPCRYEEYRRFADQHRNPERRRAFVEQLAREGCSRDHDARY
jgi:hypothetical protein